VICVLVLAVMIALATPFGQFISDAVWSTANGLFDVSDNALDIVGLSTGNIDVDDEKLLESPSLMWTKGNISSSGDLLNASAGYTLCNHYSNIISVEKLNIHLIDENLLMKFAYYDENGNWIKNSEWISMEKTNWSSGGINDYVVENANVRICIANTTYDATFDGIYDEEINDLLPRFSYTLIYKQLNDYRVNTVILPDVTNGKTNYGFTCTGLAYDSLENCFWVGNYGKSLPSDSTVKNSIVKLSLDGTTKLSEIDLSTIIPTQDIQGVTVDTSNNTLWVASAIAKEIYNISKDGTLINVISHNANGLAYDNRTDTLWILTFNNSGTGVIENITKTGTTIKTYNYSGITDADMIHLDTNQNIIYFTAGANYHGNNFVYKLDLETGATNLYKTLKESYAVEGLYINGNKIYVLNDGYYHSAFLNKNVLNIYEFF